MDGTVVIINDDKKIEELILPGIGSVAEKLGLETSQLSTPSDLIKMLNELSPKAIFLDERLIKEFKEILSNERVSRIPVFLLVKDPNAGVGLPDFLSGIVFLDLPRRVLNKTLYYSLKTALIIDEINKKRLIVDPEYLRKLISDSVHSINNILTGMQGYAELAQMNPDDRKLIEDSLKVVIDSANKVKLELKNFRAFVRVEAPQYEEVDIRDVVQEALSLVKNELDANGIDVKVNLQSGGLIHADYSQITQVLFNILYDLANVINEGGQLSISGRAEDSNYIFNISSNSIDMSSEEVRTIRKILSEPYIVMKDEEGLGKIEERSVLSICNRIIYNHMGRIDFSYNKRGGLSYSISLPMVMKEVVSVQRGKVVLEEKRGAVLAKAMSAGEVESLDMDVLVVDDEEYIRNTIHYFFSEKGCRVIQAEDGEYALDLASKQGFDIIFMDYLMPKMGGLEAAKRIKKLNSNAKIVFITGRETIDRREFQKAGVYGIIKKPFDLRELLNIAKKVALEKGLI